MKEQYLLSYAIPTYNRPYYIAELLENSCEIFKNYNFCFLFLDASLNDDTEKIVKQYQEKYDFIYYYRDFSSFSERTLKCLELSTAKYICISGDTYAIKKNNIDLLINYFDLNYDIINMTNRDEKKINDKDYFNIIDMFKDCAWDMTLFGTVFIKKESFYLQHSKGINLLLDENNPFMQIYIYFNCFSGKKFKGKYINKQISCENSVRKNNNWSKDVFHVFGEKWISIINCLDVKYNTYKKRVILDHGKYSGIFSFRKLCGYRMNNYLNLHIFFKYRKIFLSIMKVKNAILLLLLCFVPKYILKKIYLLEHNNEN